MSKPAALRTHRFPCAVASSAALALLLAAVPLSAADAKPPTMQQILDASKPADWRALDPRHTLYMDLADGRVVIELAPAFAPKHVANIKALTGETYFDGLSIYRVQDNYVTQWGDADAEDAAKAKPMRTGKRTLTAEFARADTGLPFTRLPDGDVYAAQVGFSDGFPVARDDKGLAWLTHCYGMVGAGRDNATDSGGGSELYVVIGNAPRLLDRNVTLVGRVVQGMELLSALPRGTGAMGFYEKSEQRVPIGRVRLAADVPAAERTNLELLRTDTPTFTALVESRRNRHDDWYKFAAGKIDVCTVPLPARPAR